MLNYTIPPPSLLNLVRVPWLNVEKYLGITNRSLYSPSYRSACSARFAIIKSSALSLVSVIVPHWNKHEKQVYTHCNSSSESSRCGYCWKGLSSQRRRNSKTEISLWKSKCFSSTLRQTNFKTQRSAVILDLCLKKTRTENCPPTPFSIDNGPPLVLIPILY